jgi:glutamine synthetase
MHGMAWHGKEEGQTFAILFIFLISSCFPCAVLDEICAALEALGVTVEQLHSESAAGQFEIATGPAGADAAADRLLLTREAISAVAARHSMVASFLPKLSQYQAGSGCHCHISLWKNGANVMWNPERKHGLSEIAEFFFAGVLQHLPGLLPFLAASANSYRRLQPRTWSGAYKCWGINNREAPIRVLPPHNGDPAAANCEIKSFDATANPYVGLAAIVAAGIRGCKKGLRLPDPVVVDPGTMSAEERDAEGIVRLPGSLGEALAALRDDGELIRALGSTMGGDTVTRVYAAVKTSEWARFSGMSLEEEAAILVSRY